jgi:hypothetical protein
MKAADFAYYLQGYFEINGGDAGLTQPQIQSVLKKAESVTKGQGAAEDKAQEFVSYTKGALSTVARINLPRAEWLKDITDDLKTKLNDLFIHAIDASYAGDQSTFNNIHRPQGPGGLEVRC